MYGSGQLTKKARADLLEMYPNIRPLSYFAATQAEAIGLQIDHESETLVTVPGLHHVEILDDAGRMVEVGEEGELVVTRLLANQAPVLRYKVGDRVRRLPDLVSRGLNAHQFAFIGRSGDFLHIGDTQYAARTALRSILDALEAATGIDLETSALELQFVNERNRKALVLVAACADADSVRRSMAAKLGTEGAAPVIMSAITKALSVFNSLEANVGSLKASGYFFGLSIVSPDSPELKRTEVGKVPLVVDIL
jgi:phenylacetate-CoA ligase